MKTIRPSETRQLRQIRRLLLLFIVLLCLSGITAFPLRTEAAFLARYSDVFPPMLRAWLLTVEQGIRQTPDLVLYGTDWLAFSHLVIALFFIPVLIQPVQYKYNLLAGMIACAGILPLAFIYGPLRGIPFFHQLIDCSFGVFGFLPLFIIYRRIQKLQNQST